MLTDSQDRDVLDDQDVIYNLVNCLEVMLDTALAISNQSSLPDFERRYRAATADCVSTIGVIPTDEPRERLRSALAEVGYEVSASRNLRETFLAWEQSEGLLKPEDIQQQAKEIIQDQLQEMRENVFSKLTFPVRHFQNDLSDVSFAGHQFATVSEVDFTGSSIYRGGGTSQRPALEGLFEYNIDHPLTFLGLVHLCAHEVLGHYINAAVGDLLAMNGRLGFLATVGTMCTPDVVFQEGWAQNMIEIMYRSRDEAAQVYGTGLLVALAQEDLQDIAKHNCAIIFQRDGKSIDEVRRHIAEECVQGDAKVKKLAGKWAGNQITGPMYGPAYYLGRVIVNDAILDIGRLEAARLGYHLDGLVDIGTFLAKAYPR